ncbi:hypothetical protein [Psychroserpens sp.]|jgi:hypothetical protein|uniref:hypothetical protein n=1 Tax=Psychroserpens sp. TaxID=2020870 RepID=UPI0039E343B8
MRNIVLVLVVTSLAFSCQNEENSRAMDWEQQMGKILSDYDNSAVLDYSKIISEDNQEIEFSIFKKNSNGIYKIEGESSFEDVFPLKIVYYVKNDKVIATIFTGLSPYLNKGLKREGQKCCSSFHNIKYFNSETEVVSFKKHLDLMSSEEFESIKKELALIDFVKSKVENSEIEYERTMNTFQELKEKLNF